MITDAALYSSRSALPNLLRQEFSRVRCANLDSLDLGNNISQLDEACRSTDNLTGKIQKANFLSDEIGRVLLEDCFPPWNNNNNNDDDDEGLWEK